MSNVLIKKSNLKVILTQNYDFCFSHYFTECEKKLTKKASDQDYKKSMQLHGHSVKIAVSVHCVDSFFSRDFMNKEVNKVLSPYHNKRLNDYLDKVSCESLAQFLWKQLNLSSLKKYLTNLSIQETQKNQIQIKRTFDQARK